jgi:hypothetical protein
MYLELQAYQHHVFMDWQFVDDSNWELVNSALNGAGVESMQAKWEEMFGVREEEKSEKEGVIKKDVVGEEEKVVKKPRKKALVKKKVEGEKKLVVKKTKTAEKKSTTKKKTSETNK